MIINNLYRVRLTIEPFEYDPLPIVDADGSSYGLSQNQLVTNHPGKSSVCSITLQIAQKFVDGHNRFYASPNRQL